MKRIGKCLAVAAAILLVCSCGKSAKEITFSVKTIEIKDANLNADVGYPVFACKDTLIAGRLNAAVAKLYQYDQLDTLGTIEQQLRRLGAEAAQDTMIAHMVYEFIADCEVSIFPNLISLEVSRMDFTGGAHPNSYIAYANFDAQGEPVSFDQLFTDKEALLKVVRDQYYKARGITAETSEEEAIMFISPKDLPFPANIGVTQEGIVGIYNRYEVTPYYVGETIIKIPFPEADRFLNPTYIK